MPHAQDFYDREANRQRAQLISEAWDAAQVRTHHHAVIAGAGKILGTSGGTETASVMRFMNEVKVIHVGEMVEWTSSEAVTNHTITFGLEPDALHQIPPSSNVTIDADGARHAYINSPSDAVRSGFITQAPQDRIGLAQALLGVTRFRVTFTHAGIYPYICVLHDHMRVTRRPWYGRESHRSSIAQERWRSRESSVSSFQVVSRRRPANSRFSQRWLSFFANIGNLFPISNEE